MQSQQDLNHRAVLYKQYKHAANVNLVTPHKIIVSAF